MGDNTFQYNFYTSMVNTLYQMDKDLSLKTKNVESYLHFYDLKYKSWTPPVSMPYQRYAFEGDMMLIGPPFDDFWSAQPVQVLQQLSGSSSIYKDLLMNSLLIETISDRSSHDIVGEISQPDMVQFFSGDTVYEVPADGTSPKQYILSSDMLSDDYTVIQPKIPESAFIDESDNPVSLAAGIKDGSDLLEVCMGSSQDVVVQVARLLGFIGFEGTKDEAITLIWWMIITRDDNDKMISIKIHPDEITYVTSLSTPPEIYTDRASYIWAACTHYIPLTDRDHYNVDNSLIIDGPIVMRLARYLYDFYSVPNYRETPYVIVSNNLGTYPKLESALMQFTPDNVMTIAQVLGMYIQDKYHAYHYLLNNILQYETTDPQNTNLPRAEDLQMMTPDEVLPLLKQYSDYHILNTYNIIVIKFESRIDLLYKCIDELLSFANRWRYTGDSCAKCGNLSLGYGTVSKFTCYTISQLMKSFTERGVNFNFGIPNSNQKFPTSSIRQLYDLLTTEPYYDKKLIKPFMKLINYGLEKKAIYSVGLHEEFITLTTQTYVTEYIINLFIFAMYLRQWSGFTTDEGVEAEPYPPLEGDESCGIPTEMLRDQYNVLITIIDRLSEDAQSWLANIPIVLYDESFDDYEFQGDTLHDVIIAASIGKFCSSYASSFIVHTIIYVYQNGFNWTTEEFNEALQSYYPNAPYFDPSRTEVFKN